MNRRKGVPCGCDADPCGCSPKNHCVKAINNVSPDPNGDFTINAGTGISILESDNAITIVNTSDPDTFVEGKNIEFTPSGDDLEIGVIDDPVIDGTLTVNGDIIQNGAAYETHAEKVYTTNDYIVMRDGAVGGLAVGDYAGFQVEKYDGTNDGRLVIDRDGVARVGDVNDEQPLLTRSESAQLNNGDLLQWNGTDQKAVSASLNTSQIVRGSGNIGSDTKPVKIVNGVATEVTDALQKSLAITTDSVSNISAPNSVSTLIAEPSATTGKYIVTARFSSSGYSSGGGFFVNIKGINYATVPFISGLTPIANVTCLVELAGDGTIPMRITQYSGSTMAFSVEYSLIKIA